MEQESFEDKDVANYLNEHFISIKIDREERPDIDQYMMGFLMETQGHGGWPLNAILSPEGKPLYAMTYIPKEPKYGIPGFVELFKSIEEAYKEQKDSVTHFQYQVAQSEDIPFENVLTSIRDYYDDLNF